MGGSGPSVVHRCADGGDEDMGRQGQWPLVQRRVLLLLLGGRGGQQLQQQLLGPQVRERLAGDVGELGLQGAQDRCSIRSRV